MGRPPYSTDRLPLIERCHCAFADDLIYQDSTSPTLRAHFLASRKLLGNMYIDTYWANVLVLWLMTLPLVLTLYADA